MPRPSAVLASLSPNRRAVKPLIAVAVAVAATAAFLAWRSQPVTRVVAATPSVAVIASTSPTLTPAAMVVAVSGQVRHPGLVRLAPGARVADALNAAGGVLPGTDLSYVNLAQKVTDGELIVIGKSGPIGGGAGVNGGPGGGGPAGSTLVNVNAASATELETLPGIGPSLAAHIIDYRTANGPFRSVDELRNVTGIGDAKFAEIKDLVTL